MITYYGLAAAYAWHLAAVVGVDHHDSRIRLSGILYDVQDSQVEHTSFALCSAGSGSSLTTLHLTGNKIGCAGITALAAALQSNRSLTKLYLSGCNIEVSFIRSMSSTQLYCAVEFFSAFLSHTSFICGSTCSIL